MSASNDGGRNRCSGAAPRKEKSEHIDFALSGVGDQVLKSDRARSTAKRIIVTAACWGFPAAWAEKLISWGGLRNA